MTQVPQIPFPPLGITTSQVGFGCGTLVGRSTFKQAAKLVETALDLGIRYFDTAPIYGMGTAEEVLGAVVGNMPDVVIATKVGYPRAQYSAPKNLLRKYLKPVLDRSRGIKTLARRAYGRSPAPRTPAPRPPQDFSPAAVQRSLESSLDLLHRPTVDVLLAHEPDAAARGQATAETFERLKREGLVRCFGVASSESQAPGDTFGTVWQSAWPPDPETPYGSAHFCIFHGVIRTAAKGAFGSTLVPARTLLRRAIEARTAALFLVATSTPAKLKDLVSELG